MSSEAGSSEQDPLTLHQLRLNQLQAELDEALQSSLQLSEGGMHKAAAYYDGVAKEIMKQIYDLEHRPF